MATATVAANTAEYVNPIITSTRNVFEMMLGCTPKRTGLMLRGDNTPKYEVSAIIGLTGQVAGTIVVSFSQASGGEIVKRILGSDSPTLIPDITDAVGELTNMIAGSAKAKLEHLNLSLSIPNVITGADHRVVYQSGVTPICILFESEIGPFVIEFGFTGMS